jgi:hypothetical protein
MVARHAVYCAKKHPARAAFFFSFLQKSGLAGNSRATGEDLKKGSVYRCGDEQCDSGLLFETQII